MLACDMSTFSSMWWMGWSGPALLIALVGFDVWSARRFGRRPTTDADATLAERFARGEIDEDEFNRRRRARE